MESGANSKPLTETGTSASSRGKGISLQASRIGQAIEASKEYVVAGWASINEGTEGPPVWDLVGRYLQAKKVVQAEARDAVKVVRG